MQETKYYCDRCGNQTTAIQHNVERIQILNLEKELWEEPSFCKECEKEILKFIKDKPKKIKTEKKNS